MGAKSEIARPVIQFVAVYVVNLQAFRGIHDDAVHFQNFARAVFCYEADSVPAIKAPFMSRDFGPGIIIDKRVFSLCEFDFH
jgi:hypothetical protein